MLITSQKSLSIDIEMKKSKKLPLLHFTKKQEKSLKKGIKDAKKRKGEYI